MRDEWSQFTNKEQSKVFEYILNNCTDQKLQRKDELQFFHNLREELMPYRGPWPVYFQVREILKWNVHEMNQYSIWARVKLLYVLNIPVNKDFAEILKQQAILELDDLGCIDIVFSNDGIYAYGPDERIQIRQITDFVAEYCKNNTEPVSMSKLGQEYQRESKWTFYPMIMQRLDKIRGQIHNLTRFDVPTRVRMMFVMKTSVPSKFLELIQKDALVIIDRNRMITGYKAFDGSLKLGKVPEDKKDVAEIQKSTSSEAQRATSNPVESILEPPVEETSKIKEEILKTPEAVRIPEDKEPTSDVINVAPEAVKIQNFTSSELQKTSSRILETPKSMGSESASYKEHKESENQKTPRSLNSEIGESEDLEIKKTSAENVVITSGSKLLNEKLEDSEVQKTSEVDVKTGEAEDVAMGLQNSGIQKTSAENNEKVEDSENRETSEVDSETEKVEDVILENSQNSEDVDPDDVVNMQIREEHNYCFTRKIIDNFKNSKICNSSGTQKTPDSDGVEGPKLATSEAINSESNEESEDVTSSGTLNQETVEDVPMDTSNIKNFKILEPENETIPTCENIQKTSSMKDYAMSSESLNSDERDVKEEVDDMDEYLNQKTSNLNPKKRNNDGEDSENSPKPKIQKTSILKQSSEAQSSTSTEPISNSNASDSESSSSSSEFMDSRTFLKSLHCLILTLDSPDLLEIQENFEISIHEIQENSEKILMKNVVLSLNMIFEMVTKRGSEDSEGVAEEQMTTIPMQKILTLLINLVYFLDVPEIEGLQMRIKKALDSGILDMKIPIANVQVALETALLLLTGQ